MIAGNKEILDKNMGIMRKCLDCQFSKFAKYPDILQFKEDLFGDLYLELLDYKKLKNIDLNNHFNAFYTRCLISNLYSNTSWFYRRYIKPSVISGDIDEAILEEDYEED